MSQGKYSPTITRKLASRGFDQFYFNADGEIAPTTWDVYDARKHFGDYDSEGFDRYGYSAFDEDGNYVGPGNGVDRLGYTEMEYMSMPADEFNDIL